ncbi:hypothetical protein [Mycobacterium sp. IDR2000157661]|uniref:hypothetical protein n=1 Tax=Mycobacterium sp. IDR2000157661 TaxID=2867005 RepID=UPI001EEB744D|nr:hypothetical protein [Mycobacterium sp. IDR2000157661]ULE33718.1 hypothetical protein K3G64_03180 [Mycobacterium sp. IDR2000157661]
MALLFIVAYAPTYGELLAASFAGSRNAILVILPFVILLCAAGYREPPSGVADGESDWIVAAMVAALGVGLIVVTERRYPTSTGLWRVDLLGAVLWVICVALILFGIRHTVRMWPVWAIASICATPLPYLVATATLGGSDDLCAVVATVVGAVAVFFATNRWQVSLRILTTVLCLVAGFGSAVLLSGAVTLGGIVLVTGAAVPVLIVTVTVVLTGRAGRRGAVGASGHFPRVTARMLVALTALACLVLVFNPSIAAAPTPQAVRSDWLQRAGTVDAGEFPFVTRFLGPDSSFRRYLLPAYVDAPSAAVDVLASKNSAALRDYIDVVWYPVRRPVSYRAVDSGANPQLPQGIREAHTNTDSATTSDDTDWYALTWVWRTAAEYEQITVIVNQTSMTSNPPPSPQPLSFGATMLDPALKAMGQQSDSVGEVPASVRRRAYAVVDILMAASDYPRG